jgi:formate C-acetyltransferase
MLPYFEADIARGVSVDSLFETLEEFFIALNFDSDVYTGVQQGDNGQSMVLGGRDAEGNDRYNLLSELCLRASEELNIIDPKINLRVDKNTPIERLEFATKLTKRGLGFPQYCNDDVVIPGLIKLGYSPEHAADYAVAACWEFITSGNAFDIPNLGKVNFPNAVLLAVKEKLSSCPTFEDFLGAVRESVERLSEESIEIMNSHAIRPDPLISAFIDDCIERGLDRSEGGPIYC